MKLETSEKYDAIVNDYLSGMNIQDISDKYGYSNKTAIFAVLKTKNITTTMNKWNKEMVHILKEEYSYQDWDVLLEKLKPFTKDNIIRKAYKLNIKREIYFFTEEDLKLLTDNYSKMSTKELKETYFPNRTISSLTTKANKMGLISREKWNEEDIQFVVENYAQMTNSEISHILKNRTEASIQSLAYNVGLEKTYSKKEYTEEYLIRSLQDYANLLGRTPFFEEIHLSDSMPSPMTYYRYFGGYLLACREAGLEINNSLFGNVVIAYYSKNNDICLSKSELIVTNFLIDNNIKYKKEVPYKNIINDARCGQKRTDWVIGDNVIVEFFGMPEKEQYKIKMNQKIKICEENNVKLISLYKNDLVRLDSIFPEYVKLVI